MVPLALEPVEGVRITVLTDNLVDPLLFPAEAIARITWARQLAAARPRVASAVSEQPSFLLSSRGGNLADTVREALEKGRLVRCVAGYGTLAGSEPGCCQQGRNSLQT
jgi:hypothetical protein